MNLYFGVGSAHKRYIRKDLVHKRERNLTRKVRGSKGQGGSAGRGVGSLRATPIERSCGDETLRGRENQPELRETKQWLLEADRHGNKRPRLWKNTQALNHEVQHNFIT